MLPSFLKIIETDLKELETKLVQYLLTPNKPTNQVLEHIFSSGGKRIRPALFLLCTKLVNYTGEHKYPIAAVCEYIHTASLLHDDVIDNSTLRRNKPTVNSIWGDETSVLSGDLIYSTACRLMVKTQSLELIDSFAECIRFMSESELFQLDLIGKIDTTEEQYKRVVAGKTAILFEASAKAAALLAAGDSMSSPDAALSSPGLTGGSTPLVKHLENFGTNIGFAFQIFDDCLDYMGEELLLGKPVVADLLEGKITLPLIYALNPAASPSSPGLTGGSIPLSELVINILETGEATPKEKEELLNLIKETGLPAALKKAEYHAQMARESLKQIETILHLSPEQKEALNALNDVTYFVMQRKN